MWEYEGQRRQPYRAVKTRLDRTESFQVDGQPVDVAVIRDQAFTAGELTEVAFDYYGQADDGTVHYFGEDVNYFEHGKLVGHEGAFRYGKDTETLGVAMPADPQPGETFVFERAPGVSVETNTVGEESPTAKVPAGTFDSTLAIHGYVKLEHEREVKLYARDVGTVQESSKTSLVKLVSVR